MERSPSSFDGRPSGPPRVAEKIAYRSAAAVAVAAVAGGGGRRKVCAFCVDKIDHIDYKEPHKLRRFVSERGKIEPRRKTGTCARHQRKLTLAIKRARHIALLPYTADHNFT